MKRNTFAVTCPSGTMKFTPSLPANMLAGTPITTDQSMPPTDGPNSGIITYTGLRSAWKIENNGVSPTLTLVKPTDDQQVGYGLGVVEGIDAIEVFEGNAAPLAVQGKKVALQIIPGTHLKLTARAHQMFLVFEATNRPIELLTTEQYQERFTRETVAV